MKNAYCKSEQKEKFFGSEVKKMKMRTKSLMMVVIAIGFGFYQLSKTWTKSSLKYKYARSEVNSFARIREDVVS